MIRAKSTSSALGHNHLLDGMRGVAAVLVLLFHAGETVAGNWVPGGYLAVDFFFVLSGFVIANAYQARLAEGLPVRQFLKKRVARLYPAFAAALPLGIALTALKWKVGLLVGSAPVVGVSIILNSLLLPSIIVGKELFIVNAPAWSLFFEIVVNLGYALIGHRLRSRWLVPALAILAVALIVAVQSNGTINRGFDWDSSAIGLMRATIGFGCGLLIARWRQSARPVVTPFAIVPPIVLTVCLLAPVGELRWVVDLAFALVVAPVGVLVCSGIDLPLDVRRPFYRLGALSYPLYAVHFPVLRVFNLVGKTLHLPPVPVVLAATLAALGAAWTIERWVEPIGRKWLAAVARRRSPIEPG